MVINNNKIKFAANSRVFLERQNSEYYGINMLTPRWERWAATRPRLQLHIVRYSVIHWILRFRIYELWLKNYKVKKVSGKCTALSSEATPKMVKISMKVSMNSHTMASRSEVEVGEYCVSIGTKFIWCLNSSLSVKDASVEPNNWDNT